MQKTRITQGADYWYEFPPNVSLGTLNDTNYRASLHFRPMKVDGATVSSFMGNKDLSEILGGVGEFALDKGGEFLGIENPNQEEASIYKVWTQLTDLTLRRSLGV